MYNKNPKVSIMIPTYNQEQYIAQAIESCLMQDYSNLEIIVSDDNSTDNTFRIIDRYDDPRLIKIKNNPNLGRVGNYHNTLFEHTTGEWVINLDGDDYYNDSAFVSRAIDNIQREKNNGKSIVAYCYRVSTINKIVKLKNLNYDILDGKIVMSGKDYFLNYAYIGSFSHLGTLYRRDMAIKYNCYTKPYQASDFHSLIRLMILGDVILDEDRIGVWRVHQNNVTKKEVERKHIDAMTTFDDIEDFAKNYCSEQELKKWRKQMNISSLRDYRYTYAYLNRDPKGLILLLQNFRFDIVFIKQLVKFFIR